MPSHKDSFPKEANNVMRLIKLAPVVGFCAVSFLPASAAADVRIINAKSGMCLDATSEGGFVQQSKCDKSKQAQLWQVKGDRVINGYWQNQCLDIYVVKGYPFLSTVQTSTCEDWKKAQEWKFSKSGNIQNGYTGQCLVAPGDRQFGTVKGQHCRVTGDFEKWKVVEVNYLIRGKYNPSKCFQKKSEGWNNGNPIHIWDCNAGLTENKSWVYDPKTGYIRGKENPSKCLHKKYYGWKNGNPIHVWDCNKGTAENKSWVYDPKTGYIRGKENTSKCMHKKSGGWKNGNPIHVWDCDAGHA
ncbi:MAG TPA: hypothetical protein ENG03_07395, partial [Thioploca sp.]|nr:hypothetical protein [Thioploca sp.]